MTSKNLMIKQHSRWNLAFWALVACALWGTAAPVISVSYQTLHIEGTASILLFAGCRFVLAGILVLIWYRITSPKEKFMPEKGQVRLILWIALFQTFGQYLFYYIGIARSSALMAALLTGTSAFFAFLLSWAVFRIEKISLRKWAGCFLTLISVVVMNWSDGGFAFGLDREGLLLLSQIFSATAAVLLRIFSQKMSPVKLCGWQFFTGGLGLCAVALMMGGSIHWNMAGSGLLLWLAFVSAAAYSLWGVLLKNYPVSLVEIYNTSIPMFGILFTWLMLSDARAFSWQTLVSAALLAVGIGIIETKGSLFSKRKKDPDQAASI